MTLVQHYTGRTVTLTWCEKKIREKVIQCFMDIIKGGAKVTAV